MLLGSCFFFCFGCFKEFDEEWWAMVRSGWKLLVSFWIPIIPPGSVFQDPRTRWFQPSMMRRKAAPHRAIMEPSFRGLTNSKALWDQPTLVEHVTWVYPIILWRTLHGANVMYAVVYAVSIHATKMAQSYCASGSAGENLLTEPLEGRFP